MGRFTIKQFAFRQAIFGMFPRRGTEIKRILVPSCTYGLTVLNVAVSVCLWLPVKYTLAQTPVNPMVQVQLLNLQATEEETRLQAIATLGNLGIEAEAAVPQLLAALKDDSYAIPLQAMDALGAIAKVSSPTVDMLKATLQDPDPYVRVGAGYALAVARREARAVIPVLVAELGLGKERAAVGLGLFGAEAKSVVPTLLAYLEQSLAGVDENTRISHAFADISRSLSEVDGALVAIAADSKTPFPEAITALKHPDPWLRSTAARMLGAAGAGAISALPQLVPLLRDESYASSSTATAIADIAEDLLRVDLSKSDRLNAIAHLEKALQGLKNPAAQFSKEAKQVERSLTILKRL